MRCALIIPSWIPEEIFSSKTAGSQINYWQPLGTLYVASSVLNAGHEVRFLNGAFMTHEKIMSELSDFRPHITGIYSTAFGWGKAKQVAKDIRKITPLRPPLDKGGIEGGCKERSKDGLPHPYIVVGGPYPIAVQEKCLEDCPEIDAAVTGEGEITFLEIIESLSRGEGLKGIEGTVYRNGPEIVTNPPRPLIQGIDKIQFPARELLGNARDYIPPPATYKRKPVAVIMTSRGCNRRCIFCFQIDKKRETGIRFRSVENVMQEIELCLKQGYREIKFIDDTFAADYDRALRITDEIRKRNLDFTWFASACVNQVDAPLLKAFREAGCWAVLFGAESGLQKDLNTIRKGTTTDQIRKAVNAAKKAGLTVYTPFIFGIPGQTFEDGLKTIEFACELNPDIANFHALTPFPGTELYDNIEKYGTMSDELSDFTYQGAAFTPYTMTRKEVSELRQIAFRKFYSRPKFILRKLFLLRSFNDLKAAAKAVKSLFWLWAKKDIFFRKEDKNTA